MYTPFLEKKKSEKFSHFVRVNRLQTDTYSHLYSSVISLHKSSVTLRKLRLTRWQRKLWGVRLQSGSTCVGRQFACSLWNDRTGSHSTCIRVACLPQNSGLCTHLGASTLFHLMILTTHNSFHRKLFRVSADNSVISYFVQWHSK
jgi:hypothetical protein